MGVRDHLTNPWSLIAAGFLGGMGAVITAGTASSAGLAVPVGVGIAGVVYGVNAAVGALVSRGRRPAVAAAGTADLPTPARGGPAETWLRRAEAAVRTLHQQTESPADPVLRSQIGDVDDQAAGALGDLRRFAGQVTLIEQAAARLNPADLRRQQQRINAQLAGAPAGPLRDERERAHRAVTDQLDVARRLGEARETLLARMQSAALGLEGLVARMSELLALHATAASGSLTAQRVAELTTDLESMRTGLAEATEMSRAALAPPGVTSVLPKPDPGDHPEPA